MRTGRAERAGAGGRSGARGPAQGAAQAVGAVGRLGDLGAGTDDRAPSAADDHGVQHEGVQLGQVLGHETHADHEVLEPRAVGGGESQVAAELHGGRRAVDEPPHGLVVERRDRVGDVVEQVGPDGRAYVDLPDAPPPRDLPGVRLLPEFDALLCGYDSKARDRFATSGHHRRLWNESNGMLLPPLLVDGGITGFWRAAGTARRRPLEVTWFARTRRPRKAELEAPVAALEAALGITVTEVSVSREVV